MSHVDPPLAMARRTTATPTHVRGETATVAADGALTRVPGLRLAAR